MPNFGSVEVVLAARDQMSAPLVAVAENVVALRTQLAELQKQFFSYKLELQSAATVTEEQQKVSTNLAVSIADLRLQLNVAQTDFLRLATAEEAAANSAKRLEEQTARLEAARAKSIETQAESIASTDKEASAFERAAAAQGTLRSEIAATAATQAAAARQAGDLGVFGIQGASAAEAAMFSASAPYGTPAWFEQQAAIKARLAQQDLMGRTAAEERAAAAAAAQPLAGGAAAAAGFGAVPGSPLPRGGTAPTVLAGAGAAAAKEVDAVGEATKRYASLVEQIAIAQSNIDNKIRGTITNSREIVKSLTPEAEVAAVRLRALSSSANVAAVEATALESAAAKAASGSGLGALPPASGAAARGFEDMDHMAIRLGERLLILFAIRGVFNFVTGMYEAAAAITELSDQTGISIDKFNQLHAMADQVGVPFTKVTEAVVTLDKKLQELKPTTVQNILDLGLSLNDVFKMRPDDRVDAILEATEKTKNYKSAIELLGTEAILPLIKHYDDLKRAYKDAPTGIDAQTTKDMAESVAQFKRYLSDAEGYAAKFTVAAIDGIMLLTGKVPDKYNFAYTPLRSLVDKFKEMQNPDFWNPDKQGIVELMSRPDVGSITNQPSRPDQPLAGWARLHEIQKQSSIDTKALTADMAAQFEEYRKIGQLTLANAVTVRDSITGEFATPGQFRAYQLAHKEGIAEAKAYARDMAQIGKDQAIEAFNNEKAEDEATQEGFQLRYSILEAEHREKLAIIDSEKKSQKVKNAEAEAEDARYYAAVQTMVRQESDAVEKIKERSAEAVAKANEQDGQRTLADQLATLDQEEKNAQEDAVRQFGITEGLKTAQLAIEEEYYFRRQAATEAANAKYEKELQRLQSDTAAAIAAGSTRGSGATDIDAVIAKINERQTLEEQSVARSVFTENQKQALLTEAQNRGDAERRNAHLAYQNIIDKEIATIRAADLDAQINLYMVGADREIALAQVARDKRLEVLRTEHKDTAEVIAAENQLYEDQVKLIISKYDPLIQAWKAMNQDMRQEWADTWNKALEGTGSFLDALNAPFLDIQHNFTKLLSGMIADWEQKMLAPMLGGWNSVLSRMFGMPVSGSTSTGGGRFGGSTPTSFLPNYGPDQELGSQPGMEGYGVYAPGQSPMNAIPGLGGSSSSSSKSGAMGLGIALGTTAYNTWLATKTGGMDAQGNPTTFNETMMSGMQFDNAQTYLMAASTMGISLGVQAAIAGIKYLMRDRTLEDVARDAGQDFGTKFSAGTMDAIQKAHDAGFNERAAELLNLQGIISDQGGLKGATLGIDEAKLRDVFSYVSMGWLKASEATKVLDDNFQSFVTAATDGLGFIDDKMAELIRLDLQYGTNSQTIAAWRTLQGGNIATGVNQVAGGLPLSDWDKIAADVKAAADALAASADDPVLQAALKAAQDRQSATAKGNATELGDIGIQLIGAIATNEALGKSPAEAISANSEALTDLEKAYKDLGIEVTDVALKSLFLQNDLMVGNKNLIMGVDGLKQEMVGFQNLGIETEEMFRAQERTAMQMYTRIQGAVAATGGDTKDALLPMQDYLHAAAEEATKLGIALDPFTQMLINQSKDLGIWKDAGEDATNTLVGGIKDLVQAVKDLIRAMQGLPPEFPTKPPALPPGTVVGNQPPETQTPEGYRATGEPSVFVPSVPDGPYVPSGIVTATASRSNNTVVLQEPLTVHVNVSTIDATGMDDFAEKTLMPAIVGIIEDRRRGFAGRIRRGLELPE